MASLQLIIDASRAVLGAQVWGQAVASVRASAATTTRLLSTSFAAAMKSVVGSIKLMVSSFGSLFRAITSFRGLLIGFGSFFAVREVVQYADAWQLATNRIRPFFRSMEETVVLQNRLFESSQRTRQSLRESVNLFSRLSVNREAIGASAEELLRFTETVQRTIALSGSTEQESAGALRQLSQLIANPTIRGAGQEIASIREQAVVLFKAILDGLNMTEGEFRQNIQSGKLAARDIIEAVANSSDEINRMFMEMTPTIGQAFTVLNNSILRSIGLISQATGAGKAFSRFIMDLSTFIDDFTTVMVGFDETVFVGPRVTTAGTRFVEILTTELEKRFAPALFSILRNSVVYFFAALANGGVEFIPKLIPMLKYVATTLMNFIVEQAIKLSPFVARLFSGYKAVESGDKSFFEGLSESLESIQGSAFNYIKEGFQDIGLSISNVVSGTSELADQLNQARESAVDLGYMGSQAIRMISIELDSMDQFFPAFKASVIDTLNELAQWQRFGEDFGASLTRDLGAAAGQFAVDWKNNLNDVGGAFENFARRISDAITQMIVEFVALRAAAMFLKGIGFSAPASASTAGAAPAVNAHGNVFRGGTIVPFAKGGIFNGPTTFPMAGGRTGLLGEAGPEAILPLGRDSSGRLGVRAEGRATQITMNFPSVTNPDDFRRSAPQIRRSLRRMMGEG